MNMATIKAIEARSVHQIQSGQVIVDLCSVAKELVENSLDAGATSIDVRFKNNGLDLIEVQDNGGGISPDNYENVALKHYTSKLSTFDDLTSLQTFGFRGEALSSLCALSDFSMITAQADQAPKANRLEFEVSGKLKTTQIVAGQKGTTASVEGLFKRLPVRRRELEKNIKREYGKVLNLLHAYACVSTGVRFSVKNTVGKTKNVLVFSTKGNQTTKENIANVYGAKTLSALIPLELTLDFEPSVAAVTTTTTTTTRTKTKIRVRGHISRPVFGEGRQTPDRQMFFVNSRPCGLPQIAKAFNEVYKSFNVSQSPFIFADFHMDTNAYDVNVSPDKRTILLHDAGALIESLKTSLTEMFEASDQTVPQSQVLTQKSAAGQSVVAFRKASHLMHDDDDSPTEEADSSQMSAQARIKSFRSSQSSRASQVEAEVPPAASRARAEPTGITQKITEEADDAVNETTTTTGDEERLDAPEKEAPGTPVVPHEEQIPTLPKNTSAETPNVVQNAFDRMRPRRLPAEVATITIGDRTVTTMVGSGTPRKRSSRSPGPGSGFAQRKRRIHTPSRPNIFGQHMKAFAAPGSQMDEDSGSEAEEDEEIEDENEVEDEDREATPQSPDAASVSDDHEYAPDSDAEDRHVPDDVREDVEMDNAEAPAESRDEDINEEEKKAQEEARVQELIQQAEEKSAVSQDSHMHRANKMNRGAAHRDSTVQLVGFVDGSLSRIQEQMEKLQSSLRSCCAGAFSIDQDDAEDAFSQERAEERLSLTVTKDDFAKMRIVGQFNLGFILATRSSDTREEPACSTDELFIIDQHASDEKFNFERLQAETVVQNQRLVQPRTLDLTAVEEEIVMENQAALEKNGFVVEVDDSGNEPIGRRCKLVSLPLSKEVVFGVRDLEELIVLLSESPTTSPKQQEKNLYDIPRPSKVRKMFAMRACRSSIMIGKNLTQRQMEKVVRNMGTIDKPWNCPHGRPTMRHLMSLGQWSEWDEFGGELDVWRDYMELDI